MSEPASEGLALLRKAFPPNQVSKLPKQSKAQLDQVKADRTQGVNCPICGGWHHKRAVHLDYVGHAALTDRLLDADPLWSWEPIAWSEHGTPAFDRAGGMWIRLTVCGMTRLGYGHAGEKSGGDAVKEVIGDALRNAAMRFGAALDLWHKGDLHVDDAGDEAAAEPEAKGPKAEKPLSVHRARKEGGDDKWKAVQAAFHQAETVADLEKAADEHEPTILAFPLGWQQQASELFRERKAELEEAEAALDTAAGVGG